MDVIIVYIKGNKTKRLSNIIFTEFNTTSKKFYYWDISGNEEPKSINLELVREIKVNHTA